MIFLPNMAQFMDHHQLHRLFRAVHEKAGKTKAVFPAATAVASPCGCDAESRGRDTHFLAPKSDNWRQNCPGFRLQGGDLGLCGVRRTDAGPFPLDIQMGFNPCGAALNKRVDLGAGEETRRTHQKTAILRNFQRQRFPAGAYELICFHGVQYSIARQKTQEKPTDNP